MHHSHTVGARRALVLVAAVLVALSAVGGYQAAPSAKAQALPPSLSGESVVAQEGVVGDAEVGGNCTPTVGQTFTITYTAEGSAFGPYPGTFTESGTATVLLTGEVVPGFVATGIVTGWTATFTIDSPAGQVSGTKTLPAEFATQFLTNAYCTRQPFVPFASAFTDAEGAFAGRLHYHATIQTATGTFTDEGDALGLANRACVGSANETCDVQDEKTVFEYFLSSSGVLPFDTTGKATGGGQLGGLSASDHVTFAFEVKQPEIGKLQGRCLVNDSASNTRVKCLDGTSYTQIGNTATWTGHANVNGVPEDYRITVQDNGEPNQGLDTFAFHSDSYDVAGNVEHGNVQLHKQQIAP